MKVLEIWQAAEKALNDFEPQSDLYLKTSLAIVQSGICRPLWKWG